MDLDERKGWKRSKQTEGKAVNMVYQHAVITASLWYSCLVIALTFFFTFLLLPSSVSLSNPPSRTAKPPVTPSKCGRQTHTPHRKRRAASPHAFKRASVDSDVTALYLRNCPTVPIRKARCKWGLPGHRTQSRDLIFFFFFFFYAQIFLSAVLADERPSFFLPLLFPLRFNTHAETRHATQHTRPLPVLDKHFFSWLCCLFLTRSYSSIYFLIVQTIRNSLPGHGHGPGHVTRMRC